MQLSVKNACKRLKISRMTLYKYMHQLFIQDDDLIPHTYIDKSGKRVIDNTLYKKLHDYINGKHERSKPNSKMYISKINALQHDKDNLKHSINDKDSQVKQLYKLLDHQQQLNLATEKDLKAMRQQLLTYQNRSKHGFFYRLFH